MTGRMKHASDDVAERYLCAVVQGREWVLQLGGTMVVQRCTGASSQVAFARAGIPLPVGRNHLFDPHAVATRDFLVLSDLELRIDDRGAALAASTEDVG